MLNAHNVNNNANVDTKFVNTFKRSLSKYGHLFTNNRIEKFYNERIHVVDLTSNGFVYNGEVFASLSNVVKAIRVGRTGVVSPSVFFKVKEQQ